MLTRLPDAQIPDDLGGFYDAMAQRAGPALQPLMYRNAAQRDRFDRVLALLAGITPCGACLELGCSEGLMTQRLAGMFDYVDAVDISAVALARAPLLGNVGYYCADAVTFEPPLEGYDAVLLLEILEHVREPAALLRRYAQIGRLVMASCPITEPVNRAGAFDVELLGRELRPGDATGHIWYMDWPGFLSWFDGLHIKSAEQIGHSGLVTCTA